MVSKKEILKSIYSSDKTLRRKAVKDIAKLSHIDDNIIEILVSLLTDKDNGVVDAAYQSLIDIDNDFIIKKLIALLSSPNFRLRSYASEILMLKGEKCIENLIKKLKKKKKNARKFSLDILGNIGDGKYQKYVFPLLRDKDVNVRYAAAEALGKIGDKTAATYLLDVLNEEEELWVKYAILFSLGKIGDEEIAEELLQHSVRNDYYLFDAILDTVSKIGSKNTLPSLFYILLLVDKYAQSSVVSSILNFLARYGYECLKEFVLPDDVVIEMKNLLYKDIKNKDEVIILLSYLVKPYEYKIFLPFLQSENESEIIASIVALKNLKNLKTINYLIKTFEKYDSIYIRVKVLEALEEFISNKIFKWLIKIFVEETDTVKIAICKILISNYYDKYSKEIEDLLKKMIKEGSINFKENLKYLLKERDMLWLIE